MCNQTKAIVDAALNQQPGAKWFCKDLNFYSCMVDYIERQWLALCGGWGSVLCRGLRLLLLTWLNQDHDVLYARMCVPNARCDKHLRNRSECWGQSCVPDSMCSDHFWGVKSGCWAKHLLQPGRHDIHMLLVQCNPDNLSSVPAEQQTEELCLAAVQRDGMVLVWVRSQTPEVVQAALNQEPAANIFVNL